MSSSFFNNVLLTKQDMPDFMICFVRDQNRFDYIHFEKYLLFIMTSLPRRQKHVQSQQHNVLMNVVLTLFF